MPKRFAMHPICAIMEKLCSPKNPGTTGRKDLMKQIFESKEDIIEAL